MSTRKLIQAVQQLSQQIGRLIKSTPKRLMGWLLRGLLAIGRPRFAKAGFVLPTTVLLLLVVSLTVGSISLRTFNRTTEASNERQQDVIYNAATPAIDRAKAKLEYMFDQDQDTRYPGGIPNENFLVGMMLNRPGGTSVRGLTVPDHYPDAPNIDPYTFPDEQRIKIAPASADLGYSYDVDNAWTFPADTDGDGQSDATIAYSILMQTPLDDSDPDRFNPNKLQDSSPEAIQERAGLLQVRNGPLSNTTQANSACRRGGANAPEGGWTPDPNASATIVRKNFQVNAFVLPNDPANTAVSTLEFFQDRKVNRGNKWGAWFRNDLEIFPGPAFNWNGAMHTEGSLIVGKPSPQRDRLVTSYLISSPDSCLYSKAASEVTFGVFGGGNPNENGGEAYQGYAISGGVGRGGAEDSNSFGGQSIFHVQEGDIPRTLEDDPGLVTFDDRRDSVQNLDRPTDYTLDPVLLLTQGISKARGDIEESREDPAWQNDDSFASKERIYAQKEVQPYVDDSFRADDRVGPKPQYAGSPIPGQLGDNIDPARADLLRLEPPVGEPEDEVGFDGYWERRARFQGLRLIVGQRLELGNAFGWNSSDPSTAGIQVNEPLRPWLDCSSNNTGSCNQARQRRSLYDNLAAVQATAVYHANGVGGDRDTPRACLATTVHPGTAYTLERSATFENLREYDLYNGAAFAPPFNNPNAVVNGDFFRGRGTNGWEYDASSIVPNLINSASPLNRALRNLARYAGDPRGGAPSFKPENTDGQVHPYPSMAMWGDFSNLRRVVDLVDAGAGYNTLSPADKTTLHTAACTLGMLAYNVNYLLAYQPSPTSPELTRLDGLIGAVFTGSLAPGVTTRPPFSTDSSRRVDADSTPEDVITALETWRDSAAADPGDFDLLNRAVYTAQMLATREQMYYDMYYGFQDSRDTADLPGSYCDIWDPSFPNLLKLCSQIPHYPILFSLFPAFDLVGPTPGRLVPIPTSHGDIGVESRARDREDAQVAQQTYISLVNGNSLSLYRGIGATDPANPAIYPSPSSELSQIQIAPKPRAEWILPNDVYAGTSITPNNGQTGSGLNVLIRDCSTTTRACMDANYAGATPPSNRDLFRVAFKDSAFMNGRELLGVRALDMDLDLMRTSGAGLQSDFWLPKSGIVYAFREDAVSESNIVRPASDSWSACNTNTALETQATCQMNTGVSGIDAYSSTDPPLNSTNLITPKPVDYYADPDRRPNGFRLRNGIQIGRNDDQNRGMTFVSDNPVYIQGDFNWHQTDGGRLLEEFREQLLPDYSNFYDGRSTPELDFANSTRDLWRPAEILADAITILSRNFCDGSIQDGIITATRSVVPPEAKLERYGCLNGVTITSYFNQGRPSSVSPDVSTNNAWRRASKAESESYRPNEGGRTPILVNRYGNPFFNQPSLTEYTGGYDSVRVDKFRNVAAETRVNATIVSGIVPSRRDQSYGGLHNFPRFLESWQRTSDDQIPLRIAGSFIQLNFSNYATGPFDQDAFEVGSVPLGGSSGGELINYYLAPNRFWGYDVGLQYAPAGSLARRFVTLENERSEFYSEPPANDPYLYNLCQAAAGEANRSPVNSCTAP